MSKAMVGVLFMGGLVCCAGVWAQSHASAGGFVPLPAPGYGLYFQDSAAAPNLPSRWGYNDGWEDGRRDRNHGDTGQAQEKERYTSPPEHGYHPGITRDQFVRGYRSAYTRGYEHGSRL